MLNAQSLQQIFRRDAKNPQRGFFALSSASLFLSRSKASGQKTVPARPAQALLKIVAASSLEAFLI